MIRFDKLKIVTNIEDITDIDTTVYVTQTKDEEILYYKYKQETPFYGAIAFARELSNYILAENSLQMTDENEDDDELLTKQDVKEKFNVSDTTLWLWAKKNYLVPVKIGRKVMYRTSDIKQLVNGKI